MAAQQQTTLSVSAGPIDSQARTAVRRRVAESLLLAALCGLLYYAAAELGLALRFPDIAYSALWPPNALTLSALLLTPRGRWWIVLLAIVPAHFAAHAETGLPLWRLCWQIAYSWTLGVSAACLMRVLVDDRSPFESLRGISAYLSTAVFVIPALTALLAPGIVLPLLGITAAGNEPVWLAWRSVFLSNAVAFLTLTPAMVLWGSRTVQWLRRTSPLHHLEAALIGGAILFVFVFVFELYGKTYPAAALYALLGPLLWAATRFGVGGAASTLFVIATISTMFAVTGRSPFPAPATVDGVLGLQMFLLAIALPILILAVLMDERVRRAEKIRASEQALRESEERYREIIESQTELVCRFLPDTTLTFVNAAYCRFFDTPREVLIGKKFLELVPESSRPEVRRQVEIINSSNRAVTNEHAVLLPDGTTGWQQWVNYPIHALAGGIVEYQAIGRDITELKRAEESLRLRDERFQLVLRATNDVILDWNIVSDTLWWSANGQRLFDTRPEGGRYDLAWWSGRIHPDDRERVTSDLQSTLSRGDELWESEYRIPRADGSVTHVNERGLVVQDADGRPLRMISSLVDITDRKRLEEANRTLARFARLAAVGEINASIAHEINQPLGAILNNVEAAMLLLGSGAASPEELSRILDDIRKDNLRASEVIRRLRTLLQNNELHYQLLDVNEVVAEVVDIIKSEAKRRRVTIATTLAEIALVQGDRIHLQQVLLNLILNSMDALKETAEAMRRIDISTRASRATAIELCVCDQGCGIDAERLPKLFDSFYTSKAHGMGLGLSIARSIVEAHGGRIWAENNADARGASFRIELPLRAEAALSVKHVRQPPSGVGPPSLH